MGARDTIGSLPAVYIYENSAILASGGEGIAYSDGIISTGSLSLVRCLAMNLLQSSYVTYVAN